MGPRRCWPKRRPQAPIGSSISASPTIRVTRISICRCRSRLSAARTTKGAAWCGGYLDANNYYIARWNPLEDNFRVYKVEKGKRTQLDTADVKLPADRWHTLKIRQIGEVIECFLDGTPYLNAEDDTFPDAGKIGLWSKSDAVSHFDDVRVTELK